MPNVRPPYPNELYHYGVKGMHWGVRRYQPYPKGYSGSGKYLGKRSRVGMFGKKNTQIRKLTDSEKAKLVAGGSVAELIRYKDQLTTQQLQQAIQRHETINRLNNLKGSKFRGALKRIAEPMGDAQKILKAGTQFYEFGIAKRNAEAQKNAKSLGDRGYTIAPADTYSGLIKQTKGTVPVPTEWSGLSQGRITGIKRKKTKRRR